MANFYPKVANFDDQISTKENVRFDLFVFSDAFLHVELSEENPSFDYAGAHYVLKRDTLFRDGNVWEGNSEDSEIYVLKHAALSVTTVILPKRTLIFDGSDSSALRLSTQGQLILEVKAGAYFVHAGGSGRLYFNGKKVEEISTAFHVGDRFILDGVSVEYRPDALKITGITQALQLNPKLLLEKDFRPEYPEDFPEYRRSPRIFRVLPTESVDIEAPEALPTEGRSEIIRTLLPPLVMIGASVLMSVVSKGNPLMMVSMAAMSVVTAAVSISAYFTNKKDTKVKIAVREENYVEYLGRKQEKLNQLERAQRETLNFQYPDIERLSAMAVHYHARIYERVSNNEDYLSFSLGRGQLPPSYKIDFKADEREKDELTLWTKNEVITPRELLDDLPIATHLLGQTLGLAGIYPVLKTAVTTLLFQTAFFHSYHSVEFITLVPEESYEKDWKKWSFLPHYQIEAFNLRGIVHNAQSRDMILNSFYRMMALRKSAVREAGQEKPRFAKHYILTILEDSWLAGHGLNEFLAEDMSPYGVTVIWGKESATQLPETVTTLVQYYSAEAAQLVNEDRVFVAKDFKPYHLPETVSLERALSALSNLQHLEVEKNAIPEHLGFLELYKVKTIEELDIAARWEKADASKTLAVPLGLRGKDDIVELNLHEKAHGPHGLVAGTTGSGKSETLQSYLLSLAVNFAPEDIGFLPIDFKGGGMANEFKGLPHMLGSITNLDGASSARALASIHAELTNRQAQFAKYGVNHINGYTKLYKQGKSITDPKERGAYPTRPIPHLFLISDEFAELKQNEPDFMAELVSVARIGRSLGVHLILATQKPSGVVDDQIWSNSRFKLALKVADEADSNEILKTPDAAHITQIGRAYLQVGNNEIYELFQSAYSGADYDPNAKVVEKADTRVWLLNDLGQLNLLSTDLSKDDDNTVIEETEKVNQLHAIVAYIKDLSEKKETILPDKPWLPPLGSQLVTPALDFRDQWTQPRDLTVPLALLDIPSQQTQKIFEFNFEKQSHTAIYGSAGFGKSTVLQTLVLNLARKNTPEQVQFNLLDFGTNGLLPLKDLPHVADLVRLDEHEKLMKMLDKIHEQLEERKRIFQVAGVSSLKQYEAKTQQTLPYVVSLLDGYDALAENDQREAVDPILTQVLREGSSLGMYLVLTANRSGSFRATMTSSIATQIVLYLLDETDLSDLIGRNRLIQQAIVGRGQMKWEDEVLALQVYLPKAGESSFEILSGLSKEIEAMQQTWTGEQPEVVPMVPDDFNLALFKNYLPKEEKSGVLYLGLNKLSAELESFELFKGKSLGLYPSSMKQNRVIWSLLFNQLPENVDIILLDDLDSLSAYRDQATLYFNPIQISEGLGNIKQALQWSMLPENQSQKRMIIFNGALSIIQKLYIEYNDLYNWLNKQNEQIQFILLDNVQKVATSYENITALLRENVSLALFGGSLDGQLFVSDLPPEERKQKFPYNVIHAVSEDEYYNIVMPEDGFEMGRRAK
ncbi:MAG: type VII secretion protein EssC [Streptococcaceae bacterium]|jgi:S-DNA-T family DNA segregation ATPase FtsK/SpoIIIE|nr:type VII secretion protein EssC [Streptococcaceae bacterium]